ncbi:glycoside hydrolase family 15 protein [Halapricum desulfuricans]|uniref:Glycosyl hydrolase family 15 n=1 Tax=Halapricum desulfuricans TaxID=2841257 RepID=A0A897N2N3_9EURY|nr:glycoside hydrolase family 15 protein [Halapricum desulfuricans]QSG06751.1 Glycosyl hydrolase family 15 [Halapricum desulfuricans]
MEPPIDFQVPSDKDAIASTPAGDGQDVLVSANCYAANPRVDAEGAIIEETSAFRSDVELFYDYHTLLWDPEREQTLDNRDDAVASDVDWASSRVPEIHLDNEFVFADGMSATLSQRVVESVDRCSMTIHSEAAFEEAGDRTLYTLLNFGINGHSHEDPNAVHEAQARCTPDHDVIVADDDDRFLAIVQEHDGKRRFDGYRIGHAGESTGRQRSAWAEIYEDNNGWLTNSTAGAGDLDGGFGLFVEDVERVEWTTAIGFAHDAESAIHHAVAALDAGYETDRAAFVDAWESWHAGVTTAPTGEDAVDDRYERSLTAIRAARDSSGGMVAGAFKPKNMTYRFIWPRDQVIMIQALLAAGADREARDAVAWLDDVQITGDVVDDRGIERHGTWWQNYYTDGSPHWTALQLDQVGGPIYAHWLTWRETGDDGVLDAHYDMSRRAAEFLLEWDNGWGFPDAHQDPWEETWGHSTEGSAAAIAGLRCMAELAEARGEDEFAVRCRKRADVWADNFETYCYRTGTPYGDHFVTADKPEHGGDPAPDARPDAAAFMAYWPWNVVAADADTMRSTVELTEDPAWVAEETPCIGRYPGDRYTPTGRPDDGGWPLCEAYADVVRWQSGLDPDAIATHVREHAGEWTTTANLLPERVASDGTVDWNSNLQWSQATYVLLVESRLRGEPYGLAPGRTDSS